MFLKKMMAVATASVFLVGTLPVEAGTFGKSSSSSSSSSRSSSFSKPSRSSSSFGSSSSSSSSSSSASKQSGISQGNSIGMSRSSVANNVKSGNYTAPSNGTTVAGSNPGGRNYNNSSSGYGNSGNYANSNTNSYNNRGYNNNSYNNGYQQPRQGHSTGTVVGAAAAGALAGYALGNHNNQGNTTVVVPNGGGNNGTAYNNGNNGTGAPVVVDNNGNYVNAPANVAPHNANYNANPSGGFGSFIWTLLKIVLVLAILFFIVRFLMGLFNRKNSGVGSSFSSNPSPVFNSKTPEDEIRDMKEDFFVQFQQNNRPSGMDYIRQQSTPVFFNAVEDFVREQDESRTVKVRQIDAQLVDLVQDGSRYVASVRYHAVVSEGTAGNMNDNEVKELWNFVYENNRWKLAGIDQL